MVALPLSTDFIAAAIFPLLFLLLWRRFSRRSKTYRLPPGPNGWPIIGNLHLLKPPLHRSLQNLSGKYGPVMCLRLGSINTVFISSCDAAKRFFKTNDAAFASRPLMAVGKYIGYNYSNLVFSPYGEYWRQVRKLCVMELLTVKSVDSFKELRRHEIETLVANLIKESQGGTVCVHMSEALSRLSTDITWTVISGRKISDKEFVGGTDMTFKKLLEEIAATGSALNVGDFIPWIDWMDIQGIKRGFARLNAAFDAFAEKIIAERHAQRADSKAQNTSKCFADVLLSIFPNFETSPDDRTKTKALLWDMASAGTETTSTTIEWTMSELLKQPRTLQRLQKEIDEVVGKDRAVEEEDLPKLKYLHCVVKEAMRLHPALPLSLAHSCMDDTEVCGYEVPKGTTLFLNLWAIGRDPAVWGNDADSFRPERFSGEETLDLTGQRDLQSIPFSAGRRGCPGAVMALPLVQLTIATLAQRFEWKTPDEVDIQEAEGITLLRRSPLLACPKPRTSLPIEHI